MVLALPLGVNLVRQQQLLKSRAAGDPIKFTGPNVEKRGDKWVAKSPQITLELVSSLGGPSGSAPGGASSNTSSGGGAALSGTGTAGGGSSAGGNQSSSGGTGSNTGSSGSSGGSSTPIGGTASTWQSPDMKFQSKVPKDVNQIIAGGGGKSDWSSLYNYADQVVGHMGHWLTPQQANEFMRQRTDIRNWWQTGSGPNSSGISPSFEPADAVHAWLPGGLNPNTPDRGGLQILVDVAHREDGQGISNPDQILAMFPEVKESIITMWGGPEGSDGWPATCFLREWMKIGPNDPNAQLARKVMQQMPGQVGFDDAAIRKGCDVDSHRVKKTDVAPLTPLSNLMSLLPKGLIKNAYALTTGGGSGNFSCSYDGEQGPECTTQWCPNGDPCAAGHRYCVDDGSGNFYLGDCSQEVNNCGNQCPACTDQLISDDCVSCNTSQPRYQNTCSGQYALRSPHNNPDCGGTQWCGGGAPQTCENLGGDRYCIDTHSTYGDDWYCAGGQQGPSGDGCKPSGSGGGSPSCPDQELCRDGRKISVSGGVWDSGQGACVYQGYRDLGQTCGPPQLGQPCDGFPQQCSNGSVVYCAGGTWNTDPSDPSQLSCQWDPNRTSCPQCGGGPGPGPGPGTGGGGNVCPASTAGLTACWIGAGCNSQNQGSADSACASNHGSGSKCVHTERENPPNNDGCSAGSSTGTGGSPPPGGGSPPPGRGSPPPGSGSPPPSGGGSPPPSGGGTITTVSFKIAENPDELAGAQEFAYNSEPVVTGFTFRNQTPGDKFVWVEFKASNGRTVRHNAQIKLLGPDPRATSCSLDFEGTNAVFNIKGQNFGAEQGSAKSGTNNLQVRDWKDSEVKLIFQNPQSGQSFPVTLTNTDGQTANVACGSVSGLSLGAKVFCRAPSKHDTDNVDLVLTGVAGSVGVGTSGNVGVGSTAPSQGGPIRQKVKIDKDGNIQNLQTKLAEGAKYRVSLKAPKSLRRTVEIIAGGGTTNLQNFVLPVGDIFPLDGGDGKINNFDKSELNRQWIIAQTATDRSGDFNQDGRVNSIDWACMRFDFNKEDEKE